MRYTPSVDQGERAYIDGLSGTSRTRAESAAEYRRMIAAVERAAAAKALTAAADELERANASPNLIGLESRYGGFYSGIRSTTATNVEKLRARAAALGLTAGQEGKNDEHS